MPDYGSSVEEPEKVVAIAGRAAPSEPVQWHLRIAQGGRLAEVREDGCQGGPTSARPSSGSRKTNGCQGHPADSNVSLL